MLTNTTLLDFISRPLFALKWHLSAEFGLFRISEGLNLSVPHCNYSHRAGGGGGGGGDFLTL